ncbi:Hypothetical predicted protein [Octopus vulgaris]|uniref:Uncharacterized protein n=1 Tax=Octopus vulgaris TaxID=6645 RepID=A0AA36FAJ5_OCTVU|nr:Hypothetical predicted protein [Octopus vulgaris]
MYGFEKLTVVADLTINHCPEDTYYKTKQAKSLDDSNVKANELRYRIAYESIKAQELFCGDGIDLSWRFVEC